MSESLKVNLSTRREYATLLRHFMAGRLSSDEYEDRYNDLQSRGRDDASHDVFCAAWHLYDDLIPHRMTGEHKIDGDLRRRIAKWVLFLRVGSEYQSPASGLTDHPSVRSRAGMIGVILACTGMLAAIISGLLGAGIAFLVAMGMVGVGLPVAMFVGVSLNSSVFARAFGNSSDHWPFPSEHHLRTACSTPTYLYGR